MAATQSNIELLPLARYELNQRRANSNCEHLFALLDGVNDPEIPVISIWELGILQDVQLVSDQSGAEHRECIEVTLTPTYSGCPALAQLEADINSVFRAAGFTDVVVKIQLSPAWTTDWLSAASRQKLRDYGIAAPERSDCPQCGSSQVELISEFSGTACRSLYRCTQCHEPFEHFKPH